MDLSKLNQPLFFKDDGVTEVAATDPEMCIVQRGNLRRFPKEPDRAPEVLEGGKWRPIKARLGS